MLSIYQVFGPDGSMILSTPDRNHAARRYACTPGATRRTLLLAQTAEEHQRLTEAQQSRQKHAGLPGGMVEV